MGINSNKVEQARGWEGPSADFSHGPLRVTPDGHFIEHTDGTPFFYLADTAWELFARLSREEADMYLENRRGKGFTAVQAAVISELDGLGGNFYGDPPLIDKDPMKPNDAYFQHVDYIIDSAAQKGIYMVALPTWAEWVTPRFTSALFTTKEQGYSYGRYLGDRYKARKNIIWCLGGDRLPDEAEWGLDVWRAMAEGIADGANGEAGMDDKADYSSTFMTYHSYPTSSKWFHEDPWIDFHMWGSYHMEYNAPRSYLQAEKDYNLPNPKPTLNGEPCYENHPVNWKPEQGYFDDFDVRQAAYWSLLAGAHGHSYGCHDVWQMLSSRVKPVGEARGNWEDSLDLPGAWDMMHIRELMESRPMLRRIPDQSLIKQDPGQGADHIRAARSLDGSCALVYIPTGKPVRVDLMKLTGQTVKAWWYDPREGTAVDVGVFSKSEVMEFVSPSNGRGNDWLLVLDDADMKFGEPGVGTGR